MGPGPVPWPFGGAGAPPRRPRRDPPPPHPTPKKVAMTYNDKNTKDARHPYESFDGTFKFIALTTT